MESRNKFLELYLFLDRAVNFINKRIFNNRFKDFVVLVSHFNRRSLAVARFTSNAWISIDKNNKEKRYNEISFNSSFFIWEFFERNPCGILVAILHEMIHFEHHLDNICGTSRSGFHNLNFKNTGEKYGLIFEKKDKRIGWSSSKPSDKLLKIFDEFLKDNPLDYKDFRKNAEDPKKQPKPKKRYYKYICLGCNKEAKIKKDTVIICGDCNQPYEYNDEIENLNELEKELFGDKTNDN